MKLKFFNNGIFQKEEPLEKGWIAKVSYKNGLNITNVDLSDVASVQEKIIEIEPNVALKIIINDAPFLQDVYDILDAYNGMKLLEFRYGDSEIVIEW